MIGMTFVSFLSLLFIGAICAGFLYNMLKSGLMHHGEGYLIRLIVGWVGAWIGSPVLGHWGWMIPETTVYLGPAVLGALAAIYVVTELVRIVEVLMAQLRDMPVSPAERARVA